MFSINTIIVYKWVLQPTSVGMAIAAQWQAHYFNRPGFDMFDYDIYALCGDGCMMEGVAAEAASLAAHLKLSNLCWIYDNNRITIEEHTTGPSAKTSPPVSSGTDGTSYGSVMRMTLRGSNGPWVPSSGRTTARR